MSVEVWTPGDMARIVLHTRDAAGYSADPDVLRLRVNPPAGAVTQYTYGQAAEIVREGLGLYRADILLNAAGIWAWKWETQGPTGGAAQGLLTVAAGLTAASP
jgi:hypothetical protein